MNNIPECQQEDGYCIFNIYTSKCIFCGRYDMACSKCGKELLTDSWSGECSDCRNSVNEALMCSLEDSAVEKSERLYDKMSKIGIDVSYEPEYEYVLEDIRFFEGKNDSEDKKDLTEVINIYADGGWELMPFTISNKYMVFKREKIWKSITQE